MKTTTFNTYVITFRDLREKFLEIKGDLVEMSFDDKNQSLVLDTTSAHYEDNQIIIHKEVVSTFKEIYRIKDKETNIIAEGPTEQEAKENLAKLLNQEKKEEGENGKKPKDRPA